MPAPATFGVPTMFTKELKLITRLFISLILLNSVLGGWAASAASKRKDKSEGERRYKICFIGDAGVNANSKDPIKAERTKNQEKVIKKMLLLGCDRVQYVGDIVYPNGIYGADDPYLCQQFLDPYKDLLAKTPFYLTLGNHDHFSNPLAWKEVGSPTLQAVFPLQVEDPSYMDSSRALKKANVTGTPPILPVPINAPKKLSNVIFPGIFWEEINGPQSPVPGLCIASIDSSSFMEAEIAEQRAKHGFRGESIFNYDQYASMIEDQEKWIIDFHKRSENCKIKIALAHHPFRSVGDHGNARDNKKHARYYKFLKDHVIGKFDYFVTGHDHNLSYEGRFSGIKSKQSANPQIVPPTQTDKKNKRKTNVIVSGAGSQAVAVNGDRFEKFKTRMAAGEKLFGRETLGLVELSFPLSDPGKADLVFHYSDKGSEEWNTWQK